MKRTPLIFYLLLFPTILMAAMNIDGNDNDWVVSQEISTNSAVVASDGTCNEWIWQDKIGDEDPTTSIDLVEFRIKSDSSNLYFLAKFKNFQMSVSSYVEPMVQVAISYQNFGVDVFMDSDTVRTEGISEDASWEYLLSIYQSTPTASPGIMDLAWYAQSIAGIEKGRKGTFAINIDTVANTGFYEAGIPFSDTTGIGSIEKYKNKIINFTIAVFENKVAISGMPYDLGSGSANSIVDCISFEETSDEKKDGVVDAYLGISFNSSGVINANTAPAQISAEDIKIDGRTGNRDVVVLSRTPVIEWSFNDSDTGDIQRAVNIRVLGNSNAIIADFTEIVEEDTFRIYYPTSSVKLLSNATYYLMVRVMDSAGAYSLWSEAVVFVTVSQAVMVDNEKIDIKIDWNNPFYSGELTKIRYSIPSSIIDQEIFLGIYTMSGRLVKIIIDNETKLNGVIYTEYWDGKDDDGDFVGSGTYLVHLRAGKTYKIIKICFIK